MAVETLLFLILFLGIFLLLWSWWRQSRLGIVGHHVWYQDDSGEVRVLRSQKYGLFGKPDMLLRKGKQFIPVELKTGRTPAKPYDSNIFQLWVYCLLVESETGVTPTHGLIRYPQKEFTIKFDESSRKLVLASVAHMRQSLRTGQAPSRHHHSPARCRACQFRFSCDQSIAT